MNGWTTCTVDVCIVKRKRRILRVEKIHFFKLLYFFEYQYESIDRSSINNTKMSDNHEEWMNENLPPVIKQAKMLQAKFLLKEKKFNFVMFCSVVQYTEQKKQILLWLEHYPMKVWKNNKLHCYPFFNFFHLLTMCCCV